MPAFSETHEKDKAEKDCEGDKENYIEERPSHIIVLSHLSSLHKAIAQNDSFDFGCDHQEIVSLEWPHK